MPDAMVEGDATAPDGKTVAELAAQLEQLLRLRTLPIGMKLFESVDEMAAVPVSVGRPRARRSRRARS